MADPQVGAGLPEGISASEGNRQVYSPESRDLNLDEEDESPDIKGNILDFVLPIGVLIALTIVTGELFLALIAL